MRRPSGPEVPRDARHTVGSLEEIAAIEAELDAEEHEMEAAHTLRPPGHEHHDG